METITIDEDSKSAVQIPINNDFRDKSKCIDMKHYFVTDLVESKIVVCKWFLTGWQKY